MAWQTVVELPEFLRRAKAIMNDEEREELLTFLAGIRRPGCRLGAA